MDFGTAVYLDSELMPQILAGLVNRSSADSAIVSNDTDLFKKLRQQVGDLETERDKISGENRLLATQAQLQLEEVTALKKQASSALRTVETLEAENIRLQQAVRNASNQVPKGSSDNEILRQSCEKLQKELQQVRGQSIEAITSLKILEDENEDLRKEMENLRGQQKTVPAQ
jgi:chromosome segregation ATPase